MKRSTLTVKKLTTLDGITISLTFVTGYTISDPRPFLLNAEDAETIIADCTMITAAQLVAVRSYDFCMSGKFDAVLLRRAKHKAKRFGVDIEIIRPLERYKFDAVLLTRTE